MHAPGFIVAALIFCAIIATIYWMLHPPSTRTVQIAADAAKQAKSIAGDILVVFSADIHSEVLMALAARMAKGQHAELVAIYVIEVPMTLPIAAELPQQDRQALQALTAATEIGRKMGLEITTRTIRDRQAGPAIIAAAREENARLIVMGTYREQSYAGAPLARTIEYVNTQTHTDVLIGVSSAGDRPSMFNVPPPALPPTRSPSRA
ncbi:MAG: universal stress protein [Candidatus Eremiobacteraeota bacterium]|nr:universal stress protein [Candidatus Eremiobacteraeota bacterium]MBC5828013.1 universal stress protein [Candidatus Eremiobacteraeota bacterium]